MMIAAVACYSVARKRPQLRGRICMLLSRTDFCRRSPVSSLISLSDKLLIIYVDDLGMCRSVNSAIFSAFRVGAITSASATVPCPSFMEAAVLLSGSEFTSR
jgi:hypothetical protein